MHFVAYVFGFLAISSVPFAVTNVVGEAAPSTVTAKPNTLPPAPASTPVPTKAPAPPKTQPPVSTKSPAPITTQAPPSTANPTTPSQTTAKPNLPSKYEFLFDYDPFMEFTEGFEKQIRENIIELDKTENIYSSLLKQEIDEVQIYKAKLVNERNKKVDGGELYDLYMPELLKHIYRTKKLNADSLEISGRKSVKTLTTKIKDLIDRANLVVGRSVTDHIVLPEGFQQRIYDLVRIEGLLTEAIVEDEQVDAAKYLKEIYDIELKIKQQIAETDQKD